MQQVLKCGTICRHYNDDFISSDLIGQKFLNDLRIGTVNCSLGEPLFVLGFSAHSRMFTHIETLPLTVKSCKF